MSETGRTIFAICILIAVYILTRKFHAWRIRRTYVLIVKDLEKNGALTPSSAIELRYAKKGIFRIGIRDYQPKAMQYMIGNNIGVTGSGKYCNISIGKNIPTASPFCKGGLRPALPVPRPGRDREARLVGHV